MLSVVCASSEKLTILLDFLSGLLPSVSSCWVGLTLFLHWPHSFWNELISKTSPNSPCPRSLPILISIVNNNNRKTGCVVGEQKKENGYIKSHKSEFDSPSRSNRDSFGVCAVVKNFESFPILSKTVCTFVIRFFSIAVYLYTHSLLHSMDKVDIFQKVTRCLNICVVFTQIRKKNFGINSPLLLLSFHRTHTT